jgi:ATP-dependent helicase HrpA
VDFRPATGDAPFRARILAGVPEPARTAPRVLELPDLNFPADLPVVDRLDDIAAALREHQVVVIAGETGSGKTTQLPKIALKIGRGTAGQIGLTQPRRIAARAVAERISDELGVDLGGLVGYQVRFTDTSSCGHGHQGDDRRHPAE